MTFYMLGIEIDDRVSSSSGTIKQHSRYQEGRLVSAISHILKTAYLQIVTEWVFVVCPMVSSVMSTVTVFTQPSSCIS